MAKVSIFKIDEYGYPRFTSAGRSESNDRPTVWAGHERRKEQEQ